MNNRTWVVVVASLVVFSVAACGDDDDSGGAGDGASGSGGTSSGSGGMSSSGSGGTSSGSGGMSSSGTGGMSSSGSGGMSSSGTGGTNAAAPVACGSAMCKGQGFFRACCVDEATSTCGVESKTLNVECAPPAVADPNCPDRPAAMMRTAKGCCGTDGMCGVFLVGSPCISTKDAPDAGPPIACGGEADAGQ